MHIFPSSKRQNKCASVKKEDYKFFIISLYKKITHYRCWDTEIKGEKFVKLTTSVEIPQKFHQYNSISI